MNFPNDIDVEPNWLRHLFRKLSERLIVFIHHFVSDFQHLRLDLVSYTQSVLDRSFNLREHLSGPTIQSLGICAVGVAQFTGLFDQLGELGKSIRPEYRSQASGELLFLLRKFLIRSCRHYFHDWPCSPWKSTSQ